MSDLCTHPRLMVAYAGLTLAGLVFEFWLGKTEKVKSASILELIMKAALVGLGLFFVIGGRLCQKNSKE